MPAPPTARQPTPPPGSTILIGIIRVVLLYAVFAGLWILLSDEAVALLFRDAGAITLASTLKGWAFVAITALLLFFLLRDFAARLAPPPAPDSIWEQPVAATMPRSLRWGIPLLALTILLIGIAAVVHTIERQKGQEADRLRAVAELKVAQIKNWFAERARDMEVIRTSPLFAASQARGHEAETRRRIEDRLESFRQAMEYEAVLILDGDGNPILAASDGNHPVTAELRQAARRALASGRLESTDLYRVGGTDHIHLDFAAPVAGGRVVATRIDANKFLFPYLQAWPIPSTTAETLLFRRDGDHVLFLNHLRHRPDSALTMRFPASHQDLLAARALRGEGGQKQLLDGADYRGEPVFGIARAVDGTSWHLMAKMDKAEFYTAIRSEIAWIVLTDALALFVAFALGVLLRQGRELQWADLRRRDQEERLRALQLLHAIAEGSTDAIFAKDRQGRYLLFNREAARITGKEARQVLGQDDSVLFPPTQAALIMANDRQVMEDNQPVTFQEDITTVDGDTTFLATKGPLHDATGKVVGLFGISRDITERRRAETALRESEARYRSLFDNMLNSVVHCRVIFADGKPVDYEYLAVNPAFAAVTGITENVVGRRVSEVLPGYCRDNQESLETFGRVATTGEPTRWEHYLAALDRWFAFVIYSPAAGEVVIVTENITERKQAELTLRESESRFRALVEQSLAGIYIIQDGQFRYVNPGFAAIFGYAAPAEIIGRVAVSELVAPEDRARVAENLRRRLDGEETGIRYTFTGRRRDGALLEVEVHGRAFDYQGKPAVIGLIIDVSARKQAEADLRQQANELRQRNEELERFNRATVGRELDMIALKRRINELSRQLGQQPPYALDFADQAGGRGGAP